MNRICFSGRKRFKLYCWLKEESALSNNLQNIQRVFTNYDYRVQKMVNLVAMQNNRGVLAGLLRRRLRVKNNISISSDCILGKKMRLPHSFNIVFGKDCVIGDNCTIYNNVTFGQNRGKYPVIKDNVIIYPNTTVIGGITIGSNCVIGANSLVRSSFPDNSLIAGNPARLIRVLEGEREFY